MVNKKENKGRNVITSQKFIMESKTNEMQHFQQFATGRINNHIADLNTRYENQANDNETLEKAYSEPQKYSDENWTKKYRN